MVVFQAIKAGARGYVLKNAAPVALVQAIRTVAAGGALIDPGLATLVLQEFQRCWSDEIPNKIPKGTTSTTTSSVPLSEREAAILCRVAAGWSNKEIGRDLGLANKTISNSLTVIFHKLQVSDRAQAAVYAVQQGLTEPYRQPQS
jgi:DNA-binding NarL/FixJ family response regulator